MWVEVVPRRMDFCGCIGCPLCYRWADDAGELTGVEKMSRDLLGRTPTPEEAKQLEGSAEAIHAANLTRTERVLQEVDEAERERCTAIEVGAMLDAKRREKPPAPRTVVLDHIDMGKVEKDSREKERKKEKQRQADVIRAAQESAMESMRKMMERDIAKVTGIDPFQAFPPGDFMQDILRQREAMIRERELQLMRDRRFDFQGVRVDMTPPWEGFSGTFANTPVPEPAPDRKAVERDRLNYQEIKRRRDEERARQQAALAAFNPEPWNVR